MTNLNPVDAMTNPYRAMCAELVDALENARRIIDGAGGTLHINTAEFVLRRARTLLAQPVAEGATDEELLRIAASAIEPYESSGIAPGEYEPETQCAVEVYGSELIAYARAVLAKWGHQ
jgi:hypothetical protein